MKALDPVCGMDVLVDGDTPRAEWTPAGSFIEQNAAPQSHDPLYHDQNYYFCSTECLNKFQENPAFYSRKLAHA